MSEQDSASGPDDFSSTEEVEFGSSPSRPTFGRPTLALGIVVLVGVAIIAHGGHSTPPQRPGAAPTTAAVPAPAPAPPRGPARAAPQLETRVKVPLLGITAGWDLYARGPHDLVRIEFARGIVTRTSLPVLRSSGPVSFLVGPQGAVIRPLDFVAGYLVPDGHFARRLPAPLRHGGPALPGPHPGQIWVETGNGPHPTMSLIGRGGHPTGVSFRVAADHQAITSDAQGYLLVTRPSGVVDARPHSIRRVTSGQLVAVGPTRWLTVHCTRPGHCVNVEIDRTRGTRHVLARAISSNPSAPAGVISPDGRFAAVPTAGATGVRLVDLNTHTDNRLAVSVSARDIFSSELTWSPDSQWLFVATANGKLVALHARTGRLRALGVALPAISQLVVRPTVR